MSWPLRVGLALVLVAASCTSVSHREPEAPEVADGAKRGPTLRGRASYYASYFHGRKTASGERFDKRAFTAAHRTLPFGSLVRVTNQENGKSVVVRINDRGPFGKKRPRIIDLSPAAARKIDMIRAGVVSVTVEVLRRGEGS